METTIVNDTSNGVKMANASNVIDKITIAIKRKQTQGEICDWDEFDPDDNGPDLA